tara:strand:+ start:334 stop:657 length:324 start_codon:yes stop_codon:yes gene_type:complete
MARSKKRETDKQRRAAKKLRDNNPVVQFQAEKHATAGTRKRKIGRAAPSAGRYVGDATPCRAPGGNMMPRRGVIRTNAAKAPHQKTAKAGAKSYSRSVKIQKGHLPS